MLKTTGVLATVDHLDGILRRGMAAKAIVLDAESTGLDWRKDKTVGYVLTFSKDPRDSFYLPFNHTGGGNLPKGKVLKVVRSLCARQELKIVGFNLAFDLKFMHNDGVVAKGPLECAQVNASLVDERQSSFSLDACCRFMGVTEKKGEDLYKYLAAKYTGAPNKKQMGNFHRLAGDDPMAWDYATGDGTSTWDLWESQQPRLDLPDGARPERSLRVIWAIECRVIRVLHRMSLRGIKVDEERLHQVMKMVDKRYDRLMDKFPKDFNSKAPTKLIKLFTDAGVTDWPTTPVRLNAKGKETGGAPSFVEQWLETNDIGRSIIEVRKLRMLRDSFLKPMLERHLWNGRVHATYNQTRNENFGTLTGRLSCSDPNLQQAHKRNVELGSLLRSIFIPDTGMVWGAPDYSQVEPRFLAHYGKVKVLLDGFLSEPFVDAHTAVAMAAFSNGQPPTKEQRQYGKTLNQALLTGSGQAHTAAMLNQPRAIAERIMNDYFTRMPEIKTLQRKSSKTMILRKYVMSILGRFARLEDNDPKWAYKSVNRLLQCSNADVIKKAMADVDEYLVSEGDEVHLLNNVHDALDYQFHPEHRAQYDKALEIMQDFGPGRSVEVRVPLIVETDEGDNWAEATFGKETVKGVFKSWGSKY